MITELRDLELIRLKAQASSRLVDLQDLLVGLCYDTDRTKYDTLFQELDMINTMIQEINK